MVNMAQRYFDLSDDVEFPGRWHLRSPTDLQGRELDDPWVFTDGTPIPDPGRLKAPIARPGRPVDFSITGLGIPIVHVRVAALFSELAPDEVQCFPVEIQGQPEQFCILVATRLIHCIDERASRYVEIWQPDDGRPEKVGEYRDVRGLRIDPSKAGDSKVFRTWGWPIALIVSEELKSTLERIGATGMKFQEV
jgi:hypothetical protein